MNERYAVEPLAFESAAELRLLLSQFGPCQGKYVVSFPSSWEAAVRTEIEALPEPLRKNAKEALRAAIERKAVLWLKKAPFNPAKNWLNNLLALQQSKYAVDGAVVSRSNASCFPSLDEFDPPPSSTEVIQATPEEYLRICHPLLQTAREVILVDPYLNPTRDEYSTVLRCLLSDECSQQIESVVLYSAISAEHRTRAHGSCPSDEQLKGAICHIARSSRLARKRIELRLVEDRSLDERLHPRYLITVHGGIRFEWGVQTKRTKVDVSVIGSPKAHEELFNRYSPTLCRFSKMRSIIVDST